MIPQNEVIWDIFFHRLYKTNIIHHHMIGKIIPAVTAIEKSSLMLFLDRKNIQIYIKEKRRMKDTTTAIEHLKRTNGC